MPEPLAPEPASAPPGARPGRAAGVYARWLVKARWWVVLAWAAAVLVSTTLLPSLSEGDGGSDLAGLVPTDTAAVRTELRSVELFGFPLSARTALVQRNPEGLTPYDQGRTATAALAATRNEYPGLGRLEGALPITNAFGVFPGSAERDTTSISYLFFGPEVSFGYQTRVAERYADRFLSERDDVVGVTGSVPARSAQGALIREHLPLVELLTLLAIVAIVGVALRSVVAPVVAVISAGAAYVMTLRLSGTLADVVGLSVPSELEPVVVALLLGVVTDYVIFFLTAMRRELEHGADRLAAAEAATARYGPIVAVAGLAVAAGTGALLVAQSLFFRALGPALVFTVLVGLVVAMTLVPALMAVLGRWTFWPSRPRPRRQGVDRTLTGRLSRWLVASRRRAGLVVAACTGALALAALPLTGLGLGVSFVGSLPEDSGVRQAADAARAGFAPGILSPTTVLLEGEGLGDQRPALDRLGDLVEQQPGVAGVLGAGDVERRLERSVLVTEDGTAARYLVVLEDPALGATAIQTVDRLEDRLDELIARAGLEVDTAGLAGDTATAAVVVQQTTDDLVRIAVAALVANLLMLVVFLRAVVAAVYLLVGSMLSLGASLGLTMLVFGHLYPGAGLTFYVPFAAAVLLLAFGSDYNIFTVGNVWEAAADAPLTEAIVTTMPSTVRAMSAAGLALAASFGLLFVVPLVPFRELAFAMAVGIMVDVLVVRSLVVPGMLRLVGPVSAWPSRRLSRKRRRSVRLPRVTRSAGSPGSGA
ncbi:MMPL family transporter [Nocardioides sp. SYSU DS0663]|uniref:MMPL family transporter n=1 Tax=Nocardioides sp. SYSU DS0663 TaxID=3416445 RepID=UPI003F4B5423